MPPHSWADNAITSIQRGNIKSGHCFMLINGKGLEFLVYIQYFQENWKQGLREKDKNEKFKARPNLKIMGSKKCKCNVRDVKSIIEGVSLCSSSILPSLKGSNVWIISWKMLFLIKLLCREAELPPLWSRGLACERRNKGVNQTFCCLGWDNSCLLLAKHV